MWRPSRGGIQGFVASLHKQVKASGIKITLIEPGAAGTLSQPEGYDVVALKLRPHLQLK